MSRAEEIIKCIHSYDLDMVLREDVGISWGRELIITDTDSFFEDSYGISWFECGEKLQYVLCTLPREGDLLIDSVKMLHRGMVRWAKEYMDKPSGNITK